MAFETAAIGNYCGQDAPKLMAGLSSERRALVASMIVNVRYAKRVEIGRVLVPLPPRQTAGVLSVAYIDLPVSGKRTSSFAENLRRECV